MEHRPVGRVWDACAIGLSSACTLHCLGLPLFVALLPTTLFASSSHDVHLVMVLLAVPVTLLVVWSERGGDAHRKLFSVSALAGLCLLILAVTAAQSETLETLLTVSGAVLLAAAHLWRWWRGPHKMPHGPAKSDA